MASAVIGALRVQLGIDSAEFYDGLRKAQGSLKDFGNSMKTVGRNMSTYLTAPIVGFGALTVKTAGDFEASMNRVDAASGATAEEFKALRDLAVELGAETSFSASESADAMEMLAKNGLKAGQILDGAVAASMKLAAAAGSDLSSAADVATDVMANFGKEAKELGPLVDGITGVLLESKFGFDDYRLAIGQAGGVAGNLGVSFEDFNAVVASTSASFASGSDAGTSFKNFLTRLVPVSDTAAAAMENLGLQFFNADGSMKSMSAIAGELQSKMSGLSDENLNQAMKDIFGVDAMRTAIMLMKQGSAGIDDFKARIGNASAEEQAAARLKGFNGELEKLKGAFETLQIAIADSGLLSAVTAFVTKLAEWTQALSETSPEILQWGVIVAGLAAAIGPVVLVLGTLATAIAAVGIPVAAAIAGIAALTAAVIAFWPEITNLATQITTFLSGAWASFSAAWDGMVAKVHAVKDSIVEFAASIPGIFQNLAAQMVEIGGQIIQGLWDGLKAKFTAVKEWLTGSMSSMVESVKATLGIQSPSKVMEEVGLNIMQGLQNGMSAMSADVQGTAGEVANGVSSIFEGMGSAIAGLFDKAKSTSDKMRDLLKAMINTIFSMMGGGGGIGGLFKGLLGGLMGFKNGGSFTVGGAGGIDSQLVAFKASPGERVNVSKSGEGGGRMHVTFGMASDGALNIMPEVRSVAMGEAASAAGRVAKGVPAMVDQRSEERQFRRLRPTFAGV